MKSSDGIKWNKNKTIGQLGSYFTLYIRPTVTGRIRWLWECDGFTMFTASADTAEDARNAGIEYFKREVAPLFGRSVN